MRMLDALKFAALFSVALATTARAEEAFDACDVFTVQPTPSRRSASRRAAEPVNPKVKRPKVVLTCTYNGLQGRQVRRGDACSSASARTEEEAQRAFDGRAPAVPDQAPAHLRRRGVLEPARPGS